MLKCVFYKIVEKFQIITNLLKKISQLLEWLSYHSIYISMTLQTYRYLSCFYSSSISRNKKKICLTVCTNEHYAFHLEIHLYLFAISATHFDIILFIDSPFNPLSPSSIFLFAYCDYLLIQCTVMLYATYQTFNDRTDSKANICLPNI